MTTPTKLPIPSNNLLDSKFNFEKLDQIVNSDLPYYLDRFGKERLTLTGLEQLVNNIQGVFQNSISSSDGQRLIGRVLAFDQLKEIQPLVEDQSIILKGYSAESTLGGGEFIGHIGEATDNGGTIASGSGFYWERKTNDFFITPEKFGAKGDGVTDDTQAIVKMLKSGFLHCVLGNSYLVSDNINIPANVTLVIKGKITQKSSGSFVWSGSNRASNYPMFSIRSPNVRVEGNGTLVNQYEAFKIDSGGDNLVIDGIRIDNPNRSSSVGISLYNVSNTTINNCYIANNGVIGTYDSSASKQVYGWGNGIDFGGTRGTKITNCYFYNNGQCGAWCYGAGNVIFNNNICIGNYQSGFQYGPHASYNGLTVNSNLFSSNGADGVDINNTGSSTIDIRATITGNVSILNGYFEGDTTKPTQDGSGVATLRLISGVICSANFSINCAGVGVYLTSFNYATVTDNIIVNTITGSSGIYMGGFGNDTTVHDNIIVTKGSAFQVGGTTPITRLRFHDNILISTAGSSASLPSNTYTDVNWHDNIQSSFGTVNFWFGAFNDKIRFTGTTGYGVYISSSYSFYRLDVTGSTTGSLVYVDGGTKNRFYAPNINNTGSGVGLGLNNTTYPTINEPFIQCAAGTGLSVVGGSNTSFYDATIVGATAVSANSAIYYTGTKNISGAVSYTVKPYNVPYVQET